MNTVALAAVSATDERAAARKRIAWRKRWAALGERVGSPTCGFMAKAVFLAIQEEFGDLDAIAWPSVIAE